MNNLVNITKENKFWIKHSDLKDLKLDMLNILGERDTLYVSKNNEEPVTAGMVSEIVSVHSIQEMSEQIKEIVNENNGVAEFTYSGSYGEEIHNEKISLYNDFLYIRELTIDYGI